MQREKKTGAQQAGSHSEPYPFSVTIGSACNKQMRTFADLAEKLKMDVTDLMRQCNGSSAIQGIVKGLARELDISEAPGQGRGRSKEGSGSAAKVGAETKIGESHGR
jgi:hypothetical protein